jgi:hypothetical protein
VVKKVIAQKLGIPTLLTNNKCFEVEIVNNELYFDYKLRDGICKK